MGVKARELEQERGSSSDAGCKEDSFPGGRVEDNGLSFKAVFTTLEPIPCRPASWWTGGVEESTSPAPLSLLTEPLANQNSQRARSDLASTRGKVPTELTVQGRLNKG